MTSLKEKTLKNYMKNCYKILLGILLVCLFACKTNNGTIPEKFRATSIEGLKKLGSRARSLFLCCKEIKKYSQIQPVELKNIQSISINVGNQNIHLDSILIKLSPDKLEYLVYSDRYYQQSPSKILPKFDRLKDIMYSNIDVSAFPKEILKLKNVEHILFFKRQNIGFEGPSAYGFIDSLPKEIYQLKKLKSLKITGYGLKYIPTGISNLKNLEEIVIINYSGITIDPQFIEEVKKMPKLKVCFLNENIIPPKKEVTAY
jgi:hypothetical protein